jgi:hypothetical protein
VKWFRMYHSVLDSVKVRTLGSSDAMVDYVWLLCCASEYRERTGANDGATGLTLEAAAFRCRSATLQATFPAIQKHGLAALDRARRIVLADWADRQFMSDDVTSRALKSRHKKNEQRSQQRLQLGEGNVIDTDTDTDTDTDKTNQEQRRGRINGKHAGEGSRLPAGWSLPDEWKRWAVAKRPEWDERHVLEESLKFRDWWHAKAGKDARKADWFATWRVWIRRAD